MYDDTARQLAQDAVTVHIREFHARAEREAASIRRDLFHAREGSDQRTELTRHLAFADEYRRAWAVMLDTANGLGDNDAIVDDGGE